MNLLQQYRKSEFVNDVILQFDDEGYLTEGSMKFLNYIAKRKG